MQPKGQVPTRLASPPWTNPQTPTHQTSLAHEVWPFFQNRAGPKKNTEGRPLPGYPTTVRRWVPTWTLAPSALEGWH
jgi:hypothetical protein